jgi:dTDP-4-dehydrorhamnose reductase
MRKILITGASGLLGTKLMNTLPDATGWRYTHDAPGTTVVNITSDAAVTSAMDALRPDICIHCAANANIVSCESQPDEAYRLNVEGTRHIIAACERSDARLIFISTDYVFDGSREAYTEADTPAPLQVYGRSKAQAEELVLRNPAYLVVRLPLLYGYNGLNDKQTWPREVREKLAVGAAIDADDRELRQPTAIDAVARVLGELLSREVTGILHCAAQEGMTKYAWAQKIAKELGYTGESIRPSYAVPPGAKRPLRSWLSVDRLTAMNLQAD